MASNSHIEWTDASWNCLAGCEAVSPGCANCYAATMTRRLEAMGQKDYAGLTTAKHFNGKVRCLPHKLDVPLKWRKPRRVFVNSMSDLFHEDVPDEFIAAVFGVMSAAPQHTFQILTKRAERMAGWCAKMQEAGGVGVYIRSEYGRSVLRHWFDAVMKTQTALGGGIERSLNDPWMKVMNGAACHFGQAPLPNVWLGISAEDQQRADERIPWLLKTPAAVRFVSAEPLLGRIDLTKPGDWEQVNDSRRMRDWLSGDEFYFDRHGYRHTSGNGLPSIDWVIVGGESGSRARPCNLEWIRSIVGQCRAAGVACFVKQLGAKPFDGDCDSEPFDGSCGHGMGIADGRHYLVGIDNKKGGDPDEWPEDLRVREFPAVEAIDA